MNAHRKAAPCASLEVVGGVLARPSHRTRRHRCERPLRMDAPSTGWVTALAGLLARGSLPSCVQPSQFPSGRRTRARRLQLRGQPRIAATRGIRVPSFVPGATRGTSTFPNVPFQVPGSQAAGIYGGNPGETGGQKKGRRNAPASDSGCEFKLTRLRFAGLGQLAGFAAGYETPQAGPRPRLVGSRCR
jgi:hypothetical protein